MLDIELIPEKTELSQRVLFVEVDGLYMKCQERNKRGKEEKIAAVHQGWEVNGKRTRLKEKRHFHHQGKGHFWEDFETFLVDTFEYDPLIHQLVINGDGLRPVAIASKFRNAGQTCVCTNRVYVHKNIKKKFAEAFVEKAKQLKVGNSLDESIHIGPVVNESALDKVKEHVENAVKMGAKVLCGGKELLALLSLSILLSMMTKSFVRQMTQNMVWQPIYILPKSAERSRYQKH